MKTTNKRKNILSVLAVLVMLMATLLTACGSQAAAPSTEAETTKVETAKAEETEPAAPSEVEEVAEAEPTAEPTPEPVVYEGIDMESTLPGIEWIQTFNGIIDEPKLVIFNDDTNKKMIIENGQKVEFLENDTLLIYRPIKMEVYINEGQNDYDIFDEITGEKNYSILKKLSVIVHDGDEVPLKYDFSGDGNYTLTVTLIAKKGGEVSNG